MRIMLAMVAAVMLLLVTGFAACTDTPTEPIEAATVELVDTSDSTPLLAQQLTCQQHCDLKRDFICVESYQPWQQCTFETTWGCSCAFTGYQRDAPGGSYPY